MRPGLVRLDTLYACSGLRMSAQKPGFCLRVRFSFSNNDLVMGILDVIIQIALGIEQVLTLQAADEEIACEIKRITLHISISPPGHSSGGCTAS